MGLRPVISEFKRGEFMSRELNREIFGDIPVERANSTASTPDFEMRNLNMGISPSRSEPPNTRTSTEDHRLLVHQVETLKRRMKDYELKLDAVNGRATEMMNATKSRIERIAAATHRLEEFSKLGFQEINSKYASVSSRVSERRVHDTKVEEMVDRHTQVLNQFEVRLSQMQKIINEQEMQLMNSRSALQEALREIARLKKL